MLKDKQKELYDAFYESTHENEYLDSKTELLVGLSAAISLNCQPCTKYYLEKAKKEGISVYYMHYSLFFLRIQEVT